MNTKNILQYIPGFRSNTKWKKIISTIYYIFCLLMISIDFSLVLFTLSIPFIFFAIIDLVKNKIKGKKLKGPAATLAIAIIVSFASLMMPIASSDETPKQEPQQEVSKNKVKKEPVKEKEKTPEKVKEEPTTANITNDLSIHYIDIGQGDAILIKLPNGEFALIDGGPGSSEDTLISYLDKQGINKIDYLIATHPHEDHIGGLPAVINKYDIGQIYIPEKTHTTKTFEKLLLSIEDKGLKIKLSEVGKKIIDTENLKFEILSPSHQYNDSNLNNYSVVTKLTFKNNSFLFTGDAEIPIESNLVSQDIDVDVLKVGHHGSDTSTSQQFLDKTNPKAAVISCAKNNQYGHPHNDVIARLENNNVDIYRTDLQGTIVLVSDGDKISFNKEANPKNENAPPEKIEAKKDTSKSSNNNSNSSTASNTSNNKNSSNSKSETTKSTQTGKADSSQGTVLITPTGKKYHLRACGKGNYSETTLEDAKARGLTPCKKCY